MKIKRIVFITAIILAFQILSFTNSTEIYADNSDINNAATGEDVINVDNVAPSSPNSSIYNINEDISLITAAPEVPRNVTAHPSGSSIVISWDTNNDNSYYDLKINDILVTVSDSLHLLDSKLLSLLAIARGVDDKFDSVMVEKLLDLT